MQALESEACWTGIQEACPGPYLALPLLPTHSGVNPLPLETSVMSDVERRVQKVS